MGTNLTSFGKKERLALHPEDGESVFGLELGETVGEGERGSVYSQQPDYCT